jgi:hypothetical protein
MGPVRGQPPVSVSNAVDKVKDEKGRMNEAAAVEPVANTMAKVGE